MLSIPLKKENRKEDLFPGLVNFLITQFKGHMPTVHRLQPLFGNRQKQFNYSPLGVCS